MFGHVVLPIEVSYANKIKSHCMAKSIRTPDYYTNVCLLNSNFNPMGISIELVLLLPHTFVNALH